MQTFKKQHFETKPLLLGNVWDASSAKSAERAGYAAIGTSSAAIAAMLGYDDGEQMPFEELKYVVQRIASSTFLPLSVDIEAGFGREADLIANHIQQLAEIGVVGINIEDSLVEKTRTLRPVDEFTQLLTDIVGELKKREVEVFINVRCDAFLLGLEEPLSEALIRGKRYQNAGADGLFFPCISSAGDIEKVVGELNVPVNVMSMPDLPDFEALAQLGVKRISTGNFAHDNIYNNLTTLLADIKDSASCAPLFN